MTKYSGVISLFLGIIILVLSVFFSKDIFIIWIFYSISLIIIGIIIILKKDEDNIEQINYLKIKK